MPQPRGNLFSPVHYKVSPINSNRILYFFLRTIYSHHFYYTEYTLLLKMTTFWSNMLRNDKPLIPQNDFWHHLLHNTKETPPIHTPQFVSVSQQCDPTGTTSRTTDVQSQHISQNPLEDNSAEQSENAPTPMQIASQPISISPTTQLIEAYKPPEAFSYRASRVNNEYTNVQAALQALLADHHLMYITLEKVSNSKTSDTPLASIIVKIASLRPPSSPLDAREFFEVLQNVSSQFSLKPSTTPQQILSITMHRLHTELDFKGEWALGGCSFSFDEMTTCTKCRHTSIRLKRPKVGMRVLFSDYSGYQKRRNYNSETIASLMEATLLNEIVWMKCMQPGCTGLYSITNTKISFAPRILVLELNRFTANPSFNSTPVTISRRLEIKKMLAPGEDSSGEYELTSVIRRVFADSNQYVYETDILNDDGTWTTCSDGKISGSFSYRDHETEAVLCFYKLRQ